MKEELFKKFRSQFQHEIAEFEYMTLKEYLKNLYLIRNLTDRQFEHLTDDLRLMIDYKAKDHSHREAWESIERGYYKS